ncbi:MAG TPA: ABC transporter ATP-binding protein [Firmicutes bacterium]|nr:ABC transporter ATP-binding protein [Bacillota bacterium]
MGGQLSGGELKRALIARTLAQETDIVLLDEPTANLDIAGKEKIMALIVKRCRERNMTLVVVMHDIGLAARHMPRLILISDGKIIADGEPGVVLSEENILGAYGIETEVLWYRGELVIKPQTGNKEEER